MTDSLFNRARRVVSAGVEGAMSTVERASSGILMRESVREVERQAERLADEHAAARARRAQVDARRAAIAKEMAQLDEQARFALGQRRTDLAERAMARQVELDGELARLAEAATAADADAARLDEATAEIRARHGRLQAELTAFDAARDETSAHTDRAAKKVVGAEQAFERAMAAAGGAGVRVAPTELAEIAAMQKEAAVAARMAALQGDTPPPGQKQRPRSPAAK